MITYKFWSDYKHANSDTKSVSNLLGLLKSEKCIVSTKQLNEISINSRLLLAINSEKLIIGIATLIIIVIPTGRVGRIEDVVVDDNYRGQGIGQSLIERLIKEAKKRKLERVDLTSRPERIAANNLYQKLNFAKIETNVYRLKL